MKKRNKIIITVSVALLTAGTLFATVGYNGCCHGDKGCHTTESHSGVETPVPE